MATGWLPSVEESDETSREFPPQSERSLVQLLCRPTARVAPLPQPHAVARTGPLTGMARVSLQLQHDPAFEGSHMLACPGDLPLMDVTGKVVSGERDRCIAADANDNVPNPADPNGLLRALEPWPQRVARPLR